MIYATIVLLPLAGALIAGLFGRIIGDRPSEVITTSFLMIAAVLSWIVFVQVALGHEDAYRDADALDHVGRTRHVLVAQDRYADGRHARRRDDGLVARASLFDRLHARRRLAGRASLLISRSSRSPC